MVASAPDGTNGSGGGNRPPFESIALLLQGGGALGSYQGGVYEALAEAGLHPDWVAGISIGAINSALIAGNAPGHRVEKLRDFWESVTDSPFNTPPSLRALPVTDDYHRAINQIRAFEVLLFGTPHFFKPRIPHPMLLPRAPVDAVSYYDTAPLRATLDELVDFDRINSGDDAASASARSMCAPAISSTSTTRRTRSAPEHIMASGALPPGFPAGRDRRRALLGRRPGLQHAAAMGAGRAAARGHARLPGRPVERARRAAARPGRGRRAAEGNPVLQPHPRRDRPFQAVAEASPAPSRLSATACRPSLRDARTSRCSRGSGREGLQHRAPDLSRKPYEGDRRTTSSRAAPCRSTGRRATTTRRARCSIPRCC